KVGVAAVFVTEAVIPVVFLKSVGIPGPVDEGLPTRSGPIQAVACHGLVRDCRNCARCHISPLSHRRLVVSRHVRFVAGQTRSGSDDSTTAGLAKMSFRFL